MALMPLILRLQVVAHAAIVNRHDYGPIVIGSVFVAAFMPKA